MLLAHILAIGIGQLVTLQQLPSIECLGLTSWPTELGQLVALERPIITKRRLRSRHAELWPLEALQHLDGIAVAIAVVLIRSGSALPFLPLAASVS